MLNNNYYRVLGLDLGSKTCGIAKSDVMRIIATGIEIYRFDEDDYDSCRIYIAKLIKSNRDIKKIVLGLPKNMDNSIGMRAQIVLDFKDKLQEDIDNDIEIVLVDERRTTAMALSVLSKNNTSSKKRKSVIDKQAAVIILQNYLDSL